MNTMLNNSSTSVILFHFPSKNADWYNKEERGEENRKEHEQVDLWNILFKVHQTFCAWHVSANKHHVEPNEQKNG